MSDEFVRWFGFIGSVASLVGIGIAIWQIRKTLHAAQAAEAASLKTQKDISRNLVISDVSACIKYNEDVIAYLRDDKYELALTRISDLISQLNQIQSSIEISNQTSQVNFQEMLLELEKVRSGFRKKLDNNSIKLNKFRVNNKLDIISNSLNIFIGETKIIIVKGD